MIDIEKMSKAYAPVADRADKAVHVVIDLATKIAIAEQLKRIADVKVAQEERVQEKLRNAAIEKIKFEETLEKDMPF